MAQTTPFKDAITASLAACELRGSVLIGLVRSLKNVHVLTAETARRLTEGVESAIWYPMTHFFDAFNEIKCREIDLKPILFQAGMDVAEDWFRNGTCLTTTQAHIFSSADFLRAQAESVGYGQMHRGDAEFIGRVDLEVLDEAAGRAVLVCLTPFPKEFERGFYYGSLAMFNDLQYVQMAVDEQPHSRHLTRKRITIRFRPQPAAAVAHELNSFLADMTPEQPVLVPQHLHEALAWRLRSVEASYRMERAFHQQSSRLLSQAADEIHDLSCRLRELAYHDELTGLLNRRAVMERAQSLLALCGRQGSPVSLLMIDIDHFKRINDRHGHAAGDQVLCLVGETLRDNLRDSDLLGRIGGEEFLAVLPDTSEEGALILAECLRSRVSRQVVGLGGDEDTVTISLGIASISGRSGSGVPLSDSLMRADEALYRSKREGRNRTTCAGTPLPQGHGQGRPGEAAS